MMGPNRFPNRIRNSLIVIYLTTTLVLVMAGGLFFYLVAKSSLDEEMGKRLVAVARSAATQVKPWMAIRLRPGDEQSRSYVNLRERLFKIVEATQVERVYLFSLDNRSLVDTKREVRIGTPYFEHQLYGRELEGVRNGNAAPSILFRGKDSSYYKSGFAPIYDGERVAAILGVQGDAEFFDSLKKLREYMIYFGLFGALLIIGVSFAMSERIVSPIDRLVEAARKIGEGDLESPIVVATQNELGFLGFSMDEMRRGLLEKEGRMKIMLRGIAHEIRNPLGGIELFSGLLQEELGKRNKKALSHVERIQNETENLKGIVEQFLDYAKRAVPELRPISVRSFLEDMKVPFLLQARENGISIQIDVGEAEAAPTAWLDPRLMKQVFANLLRNSMDAVQGKTDAVIKLGFRGSEHEAVFVIEDNGVGMDAATRDDAFRPFFTTKEKGSGLGLAFVKKIVDAHGGYVEIDSALGKGTKVTIEVPGRPGGNS